PQGLFQPGGEDGSENHLGIEPTVAVVEVQGYAYAAHRAFASLVETDGDAEVASSADAAADRLLRRLNEDFWMDDRAFFALALDGRKRMRRAVTSNPSHLLLCGAVEPRRVPTVVTRLFREDLWTPYGGSTRATPQPALHPVTYQRETVAPPG